MSVERIVDKLDNRISDLIRNLGLIITILFGFSAIIYNLFGYNIIAIFVMAALFIVFLGNFRFSLKIYINNGSNIHHFVNEIQLYEEFLNICEAITIKSSSYYIRNIIEIYNQLRTASKSNESKFNITDRVKERFNFWEVSQNEQGDYILDTKSISDYKTILKLFKDIFSVILLELQETQIEVIGVFLGIKEELEKRKQVKLSNEKILAEYIEKLREYFSKILKFKSIQLKDNFYFTFSLERNIIFIIEDYMNAFYNSVETKYLEKINDFDKKKDDYENSIKSCYRYFGLTIITYGFIFVIILVAIGILQIIKL